MTEPLYIHRKAVLTLDNVANVEGVTFSIPNTGKPVFIEKPEKERVAKFNRGNPHLQHKVVKVKLMRN